MWGRPSRWLLERTPSSHSNTTRSLDPERGRTRRASGEISVPARYTPERSFRWFYYRYDPLTAATRVSYCILCARPVTNPLFFLRDTLTAVWIPEASSLPPRPINRAIVRVLHGREVNLPIIIDRDKEPGREKRGYMHHLGAAPTPKEQQRQYTPRLHTVPPPRAPTWWYNS